MEYIFKKKLPEDDEKFSKMVSRVYRSKHFYEISIKFNANSMKNCINDFETEELSEKEILCFNSNMKDLYDQVDKSVIKSWGNFNYQDFMNNYKKNYLKFKLLNLHKLEHLVKKNDC